MPQIIAGLKTYTPEEVGELFGISSKEVKGYVDQGKLAGSLIGEQWRFTDAQIRDFIEHGSVVDNSFDGKINRL